jgi:hypothetical protein
MPCGLVGIDLQVHLESLGFGTRESLMYDEMEQNLNDVCFTGLSLI